jgi:hypothetical protein
MAVVKAVHGHEGEVTGLVQRTQVQAVQDDTSGSDATLLLGLEGLAVAQVELDDEGTRVVHVVTDDEAAAGCPSCGVLSTSVMGHAVTRPRDVPYGQAPVHQVWHKRRWRCQESACLTSIVHRVVACGAAPGQGDDPVAHAVRGGDRDPVLLRSGRRGLRRGVLADRAPRVHRARRPAPGGPATAGDGARDRRDPPRQAQVGSGPRHRALGRGRGPVAHRDRRRRRHRRPVGSH